MGLITSAADGNWSSGGTWNGGVAPGESDTVEISHVVTLDANVTCGNDAVDGIKIKSGGVLAWSTAASVTLIAKGDVRVQSGGELRMGTVASPMPAAYTGTLRVNYSASMANIKHQLIVDLGGKLIMQGASKSHRCKTTSALTGGSSTSFTVADAAEVANWASGDVLVVQSTIMSYGDTQTEQVVCAGTSGTTVNLSAAPAFDHAADCWVVNLTRNVIVESYNYAVPGNIVLSGNIVAGNVDMDYAALRFLGTDYGGNAAMIATSVGSVQFDHSVVQGAVGCYLFYQHGNAFTGSIWYRDVSSFTYNSHFGVWYYLREVTFTDCMFIGGFYTTIFYYARTVTFSGCAVYAAGGGLTCQESHNLSFVDCDFVAAAHSYLYCGLVLDRCTATLTNCVFKNNNRAGYFRSAGRITFVGCTFENQDYNVGFLSLGAVYYVDCTFNGSPAYWGYIERMAGSRAHIVRKNCTVVDTTPALAWSLFDTNGALMVSGAGVQVVSVNDNGSGVSKIEGAYGIIEVEATVKHGGAQALRFDPNNATEWLYLPLQTKFVRANELVRVSVWLRKDSSFNGTARLVVFANDFAGVTAHVTADLSAAADTWERVSVTFTPDQADEMGISVAVRGTAGYVYVDELEAYQASVGASIETGNMEHLIAGILPATYLAAPQTLALR